MIISESIKDLLINLAASAIGGLLVWIWQKARQHSLRNSRLRQLRGAAREGEVAVCIRVGGNANPVPDVRIYLSAKHPGVDNLLVYNISAEEAESAGGALDDPRTVHRIIEDIREGIRAYGQEAVTRIHFFPAGMLVYPIVLGALIANWCPVVVYYKTKDSYEPLYELSRDWMQKGKREFDSLKPWEVLPIPKQ